MIDKRKNAFYKITLHFFIRNKGITEIVETTVYSNHSVTSKRFIEFAKTHVRQIKGFDGFLEDWASQQTVSNELFCK
ncbi:hypothetical protein [Bacillus pseudomycoides]|uniref:hypothetical protein n=1 Tax=Bacillus pseudomycoides TaxID=64104 RepID=UPI000BF07C8B|nr:hypothetical protein [Bacillus pseudomycoides]PEO48115.1 hypothetical protein CN559_12550 [Bacillus pseudomycoides]PGE00015.1 hypothetical protein COM50_07010 [Bacillus pseudomycoides]